MPAVATTRSPSHRPSVRSSSATGGGSSRYGPLGASPNTSIIARMNPGEVSRVTVRSWSGEITTAVYRAPPAVRQPVLRSGAGGHAVVGQGQVAAGHRRRLVGQARGGDPSGSTIVRSIVPAPFGSGTGFSPTRSGVPSPSVSTQPTPVPKPVKPRSKAYCWPSAFSSGTNEHELIP